MDVKYLIIDIENISGVLARYFGASIDNKFSLLAKQFKCNVKIIPWQVPGCSSGTFILITGEKKILDLMVDTIGLSKDHYKIGTKEEIQKEIDSVFC